MKSPELLRGAFHAVAAGGALLVASAAQAQVEALNPNPTLPAGTDRARELEEYRHGSSRGTRMGLGIGPADAGDKNPADIMLRDIEGTNRGRRTGRAAIRGGAVRAALKAEGLTRVSPRAEEGAVYFARRGDYENAIYLPYRGSYREPATRRSPTYRSSSQR